MQLKLDPNANLKPTMPPCAVEGYVGSVILLDLLKIPAEIGNVTVTGVRVAATYPDNSTATVDCTKETDGTWSCTLPATPTSGRVANGVQFLIDGKTPRGDIVTGYVLAITELAVYTRDMTVDSGGTSWIFHYFDTPPATPKKCDAAPIAGALKYYNGTAWVDFANVDLSNYATKADLSYDIVSPTVTPGTPGWSSNYAQVYNMFGELVDVSLPNWETESTPDGDKTGWFWLNPEMVYILLSEDESSTSLEAYWEGNNGEVSISYDINFTKTTSPATVTNVKDRAINAIALSGDATLTLPSQVNYKSRDFCLFVANSGNSNATITVTRADLFDPAMNAVTLVARPSAITIWRLTEMVNGAGTLVPATFIVTGANQLSSSDVIDPATATASGKAADALATKNALAAKQDALTAQQLANIADVPNKANAADLRYSFNAATVSSGTTPTVTNIADRAINTATLGSSVTAATVTLPAAVANRARDFFIDLTIEATDAPTLTFIDPATSTTATVAFGADSLADIDSGYNLILFTELPNNRWLASVKHEEVSA